VMDGTGREVGVVADGYYGAGMHRLAWDAGGLPSGVYLVRLEASGRTATAKALLVK